MSVTQIRLPLGKDGITAFIPNSYEAISELPTTHKNVIMLLGDNIQNGNIQQYAHLIEEILVPFTQSQQIVILDSGLNTGIAHLVGEAITNYTQQHPYAETAPLIGIALKSQPIESLDLNHTQFVLGDESTRDDLWTYTILTARRIASWHAAVAIVIGGGESAWREIFSCLCHERVVIAVDGSGGTADQLAAAIRGETISDAPIELPAHLLAAEQDLLYTVPLKDGGDALIHLLQHCLHIRMIQEG